jgi:DNA segregation ATPase FtsK/SpoIIIE-like protein
MTIEGSGSRSLIDQLEASGYVGPFDGSNEREVLRREAKPRTS